MQQFFRAAACAAAFLVAAGCNVDSTEPPEEAKIETTTFATALGVDLAAMTKTASGVYYRDLVVGTGAVIATGQLVSTRYTGWLSGGQQFDSNVQSQNAYPFHFGRGEVIAGWDSGMVGMHVGGKRQLVIPPSLGYGPYTYLDIPGNSVLVFQVEVVAAE
jgi:FKBP-type peptidyl-prolyl cis-trans isomerase